ncbi:MAG: DUF411 domain-containing protein [Nitrososphaerota archaeon]
MRKRRKQLLINVSIAASITLLLVALAILSQGENNTQPEGKTVTTHPLVITLYKDPTCGCCGEYEKYLRSRGVELETRIVEQGELLALKQRLGIPGTLFSCHTSIVAGYFVEGHVPLEAIYKLLEERPDIDGIALPGMPEGAPGMGDHRAGPLRIYAKEGDSIKLFLEL